MCSSRVWKSFSDRHAWLGLRRVAFLLLALLSGAATAQGNYPVRPPNPNPNPTYARPANPARAPVRPAPAAPAAQQPVAHTASNSVLDYRMGVADLIHIKVHGEDDLAVQTRLDEKGTITFAFLGEIRAVGLTVRELERQITSGLKAGYLLAPEVQVQVVEYRPFYVNGEVKKPGGYPYVPGLTVQKAISLAGGMTQLASENKIFVIRERDASAGRQVIGVDGAVLPGDTLVIEEGLF